VTTHFFLSFIIFLSDLPVRGCEICKDLKPVPLFLDFRSFWAFYMSAESFRGMNRIQMCKFCQFSRILLFLSTLTDVCVYVFDLSSN
jgi:hypothetical protein